ncbi:Oidioi.mRNA.OKI2018_I69.PAR.g13156.t1.cds [Oikopleura dioica]|uniref:Oidioi.mRNA.OKI2018_I69.PAR.g13156.t1.cds n=1 Tax=Oikopleura dioica TaxID=34765 RepID=A0ABN7SA71_OIKDI|nr:Oidioi.mRNA.OKI2018_I69.PAR.g13156.t1.cds [Oikopleura dioica]
MKLSSGFLISQAAALTVDTLEDLPDCVERGCDPSDLGIWNTKTYTEADGCKRGYTENGLEVENNGCFRECNQPDGTKLTSNKKIKCVCNGNSCNYVFNVRREQTSIDETKPNGLPYITPCDTETTTSPATTSSPSSTNINILVIPMYNSESFIVSGDGSRTTSATLTGSSTERAHSVIIRDELYSFKYKNISKLNGCNWQLIPPTANYFHAFNSAVLAIEDGKKGLICFPYYNYVTASYEGPQLHRACEIFDPESSLSQLQLTASTEFKHNSAGLAFYNGKPTVVGSSTAHGAQKVEFFTGDEWVSMPDHPTPVYGYSLTGLDSGAMLVFGGCTRKPVTSTSCFLSNTIWRLKDDQWTDIGQLSSTIYGYGSAINIGNFVYLVDEQDGTQENTYTTRRLSLENDLIINEEIIDTRTISMRPGNYAIATRPHIMLTSFDFCV